MEEQQLREAPMYEPPPNIAELLEDCFAAGEALDMEDSDTVLFRGQPVTNATLFERLQEEVVRQGIDEEEMAVAFTHMSNTPPT